MLSVGWDAGFAISLIFGLLACLAVLVALTAAATVPRASWGLPAAAIALAVNQGLSWIVQQVANLDGRAMLAIDGLLVACAAWLWMRRRSHYWRIVFLMLCSAQFGATVCHAIDAPSDEERVLYEWVVDLLFSGALAVVFAQSFAWLRTRRRRRYLNFPRAA